MCYKTKAIQSLKSKGLIERANEVAYTGICEGYVIFNRVVDNMTYSVSMNNGGVTLSYDPDFVYNRNH